MRSSTVLRICVVLQWVLVALAIALSFLLESSLPTALREWLVKDAEADLAPQEIAVVVMIPPVLFCGLVASIGLLFLRRWAAWLYLISLIAEYAILPFAGPTVEHALAESVAEIAVLLSGLILGVAFFSDALKTEPCRAELVALPNSGPATSLGSPGFAKKPPAAN